VTKFLLAVHVLAVIVAIGPVTVAASMFPGAARRAGSDWTKTLAFLPGIGGPLALRQLARRGRYADRQRR
jgi:hypothetical protein